MALKASSDINLLRTQTVRVVTAAGKRFDAIIRAVTGSGTTLTVWIPSTRQLLTNVAKATTRNGVGYHYRATV